MPRSFFSDQQLSEIIKNKQCIKCKNALSIDPNSIGFINKSNIKCSKYICKICNIERLNGQKKKWSWSQRLRLGGGGSDRKQISCVFLEELAKKQNFKDPFLGIFEINFVDSKNPNYVSLDRIDNNKGYTQINVQLVPRWQNFARNSLTTKEFKKLLLEIKETFEKNK
jgi:hypothetical protein